VNRRAFVLSASALAALPVRAAASPYEHVETIARAVPGVVGAYCRTLADGPPLFAYNAHVQFPTASTIKTLIMLTAFIEEERRPGTLARRVTTHRSELIGGSDFMAQQPDGARFSVRELITPMITLSDNTASNYLMDALGMHAINGVAHRLEMAHTRLARHFMDFAEIAHNDNVTTPADMSKLLFAIASGAREGTSAICTPRHCRTMIGIMLHQTDRDKIPAGLPHGVAVANKTGELDGSRSDVAIVQPFGDSPYVLVLYSKWLQEYPEVYTAFHRIARLSYQIAGRSDQ
jgi:beta-lactamase class A